MTWDHLFWFFLTFDLKLYCVYKLLLTYMRSTRSQVDMNKWLKRDLHYTQAILC